MGREDSRIGGGKDKEDVQRWEWYFGNSKKLIGVDRIGLRLKYVHEMTLRERGEMKEVGEKAVSIEKLV